MSDAGFAAHFFDGEVVIFGDFFDDLFTGDRTRFAGAVNIGRAVLDEFERSETADFGH